VKNLLILARPSADPWVSPSDGAKTERLKSGTASLTVTTDATSPMLIDPVGPVLLLWGTLGLRPYVFAFLVVFLVAAGRDLGAGRAVSVLLWGFSVAWVAEYASTRVGVPFGLYHYTGLTKDLELYVLNVPFFDSLSFPFLAYAAFCRSRRILGRRHGLAVVLLAGILMMLLDVVIDPLAVRGDRWFLGRIFYYPAGGIYFGVPLSNFAGWALVGWVIVGGYVTATTLAGPRSDKAAEGSTSGGIALYYGVLLFNLAITAWIGEWTLMAAGILVQVAAGLLLYVVGAKVRQGRRSGAEVGHDRTSADSEKRRGSLRL